MGSIMDKDLIKLLNAKLSSYSIEDKVRCPFIGLCLLLLRNGLSCLSIPKDDVLSYIKELVIRSIPEYSLLQTYFNEVLSNASICHLDSMDLYDLLYYIEKNVSPYIAKSDILSLFFTTYNKYFGKLDKNQVYTPDHICDFISKVVGVNKHSRILDPCCGSGAFLVRGMSNIIDDCDTDEEREIVKRDHVYGIENDSYAFCLSVINMLLFGDSTVNVVCDSMFNRIKWIKELHINVVLMNPPYNAPSRNCDPSYVKTWKKETKEDPSKGFHYVYEIARIVGTGKLAVILPTQCAIGSDKETDIRLFKRKMLEEHTLDAVFSFPPDIFHPSASAVVCCMIFNLGVSHKQSNQKTFFGYFRDDGFVIRKGLGRVERATDIWSKIEKKWLELYFERKVEKGYSAVKSVAWEDEWLAEAYMETNYDSLDKKDFQIALNDFYDYSLKLRNLENPSVVDTSLWRWFNIGGDNGIFEIENCKCSNASKLLESGVDIEYIGAKKTENGVMCMVKRVDSLVTKGNCIIFICDGQGSVGYTNYIDHDFIGSTTLSVGRNPNLNIYNALFIVTILDRERYRYSFGRKYKNNLHKARIKLPVDSDGNPDWQFMENYIKSLPYGDRILG